MNKITVIICCYNGEKRIGRVLENTLRQNEINSLVEEILVVDNHSTDQTKKIILDYQYMSTAIPVRYVYEDKPGLSNARKAGVDSSFTEWIVFLDDDNFIQDNWFIHVTKYIDNHSNIVAFNGAVIPKVEFIIDDESILKLKSSLKVLACTHYCEQDILTNPTTPFRNPIGAGMVIRTAPLKKLSAAGWLNSPGRTKDNLTSGEDGEMAFYVKSKAYNFGFCSNAILLHEMTPERLEDQYLHKMWYEIGRGVCVVLKKRNLAIIKNIAYRLLLEYRLLKFKKLQKINKYYYLYYSDYMKGYIDEWKKRTIN